MQVLGLHDDRPFLRIACLESTRGVPEIRSIKSTLIHPLRDDVKQLYTSDWKGQIGVPLPALVRHLNLKVASSNAQIDLGLRYQIESLTHIPPDEICYASKIQKNDKGAKATVFFLPKAEIRSRLDAWNEFSIEPDFAAAEAQALIAFARFRCPELQSAFLIHLGSNEWSYCWMENGKVERFFSACKGIETLLAALWEDRKKVLFQQEIEGVAKQIDLLQLKPLLNPHLSEQISAQGKVLSGILHSFEQAAGPRPLFFTGRINAFGRLPEYLAHLCPSLPIYSPQSPLSQEEYACALAMGTALEIATGHKPPVQLLKQEFTPRKIWRKAGLWSTALLCASFLISATLLLIGQNEFQNRKREMADILRKLIEPKSLKSAFAAGIDDGIEEAFRTIEKHEKNPSYILAAPTVTEFLSWLTTHETLCVFEKENDPLELLEVHYQLISSPKIHSPKDPYRAKVSFEFRLKSPMNARKFHDILLTGNGLIDAGEEISWEAQPNSYRASFILKNRDAYVP